MACRTIHLRERAAQGRFVDVHNTFSLKRIGRNELGIKADPNILGRQRIPGVSKSITNLWQCL